MLKISEELLAMRKAGSPLIYVHAPEDIRCLQVLTSLFATQPGLGKWDVLTGWTSDVLPAKSGMEGPLSAIQAVAESKAPGVFLMHMPIPAPIFQDDILFVQALKNHFMDFKGHGQTLIIVAPVLGISPQLEKDLSVVRFPLPNRQELGQVLDDILANLASDADTEEAKQRAQKLLKQANNGTRSACVDAAIGMTESEAEDAFSLSIVTKAKLDPLFIAMRKAEAVKKSDVLEIMTPSHGLEAVGGMQNLKRWLDLRKNAFSKEAKDYGIESPRGILVVGSPGSGKSLVAKAVAYSWGIPLLRLDMGRVYSSLMGSSEARIRQVIDLAEAIGRVVLFIDEAEKGLAGTNSSGNLDSGVSSRVGGALFTWLQEKTSPAFVVATCNHIENLPAEFTRRGRFDAIFHVDLPNAQDRVSIFEIHLAKRRLLPEKLNLNLFGLAAATDKFSGAEIESVVVSAMFRAFSESCRDLKQSDLVEEIKNVKPLAISRAAEIEKLRKWAEDMAIPAGLQDIPQAAKSTSTSKRRTIQ